MGHAQRVCYIVSVLGLEAGLGGEARLALFYAALFHDIGVPMASAALSTLPGRYSFAVGWIACRTASINVDRSSGLRSR